MSQKLHDRSKTMVTRRKLLETGGYGSVLAAGGALALTGCASTPATPVKPVPQTATRTPPRTVTGGGGAKIAVYDTGNPAGKPLLFIHGYMQSHQSWIKQFTDESLRSKYRLVAMDMRGHGESQKLPNVPDYQKGSDWADDVSAVITELKLNKPVVSVWSYGGFVIGDYIKKYGDGALGGINFVGAAVDFTKGDPAVKPPHYGDGMVHVLGTSGVDATKNNAPITDPAVIRNHVREFVKACFAIAPTPQEFESMILFNEAVPMAARQGLVFRPGAEMNFSDTLRKVKVPALITFGRKERLVLPAHGEYIKSLVPQAQVSFYDNSGHAPFFEEPKRFNAELAKFAG
jgi:non-heme chloroperoxidase